MNQREAVPVINLSRRRLMATIGIGAGGMLLGVPPAAGKEEDRKSDAAAFGPMLGIGKDGRVTLVVPSSEMGQGTQEALARIVAEELDCDWSRLEVVLPWADPAFANPRVRRQLTANSMTVTGYYPLLRKLGAGARAMLVEAASRRLGVPPQSLMVSSGEIREAAGQRVVSFGEVALAASALPVPVEVALKPQSPFRIIGGRTPRKDLHAKVTGRAEFGMDVRDPGMLVAALVLAPHPAAGFAARGLEEARGMPGVVATAPVPGGIAVLADRFWRAKLAAEKISLAISASPIAGLSDETLRAGLAAAFDEIEPAAFPNVDLATFPPRLSHADKPAVLAALKGSARRIEAAYEVPHLAHAAMEPLCCAARFDGEGLLIRGPLQDPDSSRALGARLAGLPVEKVRVEVTFLGGGFGRKWGTDFVAVAIEAARAALGRLVKTIWTREQDFAADQFRPAFAVRSVVGLDADDRITAIHSRIAGESLAAYHRKPPIPGFENLADANSAAQLIYGAYAAPNKLIEYHKTDLEVPVGFWRSVTMSQNAFFGESLIDEVARGTNRDPLAFRLELLAGHPRLTPVLRKAAEMIGWERKRKRGTGRGIAFSYGDSNFCAIAVEVTLQGKALQLKRIACAFDGGLMIDPLNVEAQLSGGIIFGLQAALWGEVHFADGRPTAGNFADYRMPLLSDVPPIDIALLPGSELPGSVGEASTPVIAPALCNAIADAGGPRIRALPVARSLEV